MTPERFSATLTYASGGAAILFGLNANEIAALTAAVVCVISAVATIWTTWHFKNKHFQLAKEAMERNTIMHLPTGNDFCHGCPMRTSEVDKL